MPLIQRVYSVLIVSAAEKFNNSLAALLPEKDFFPIDTAESVNEAQRKVLEKSYDLVFINAPLPDDFGRRFAIDISSNNTTVVLLFVKNEIYDEVYSKVYEHGVLTMRKPTATQTLEQSLDGMRAVRERLRRMEKKAVSLEEKMSEIRTVNRAKWVLIDSLKMTEEDAHRYIEKQAMDRCVSKTEIAEGILKTYK